MGARLSQPRGPAGTTESSLATSAPRPPTPKSPFPRSINRRTIVAPAAALTMACLLFVYSRTSIRAAKANAQRHRDADSGGEGLSLLHESRRRHGLEKRLDRATSTVGELVGEARDQVFGKSKTGSGRHADEKAAAGPAGSAGLSDEDQRIRAIRRRGRRGIEDDG